MCAKCFKRRKNSEKRKRLLGDSENNAMVGISRISLIIALCNTHRQLNIFIICSSQLKNWTTESR